MSLVTIAASVHAKLARPEVGYEVGAQWRDDRRYAPPHVVWAVDTVAHAPPMRVGGQDLGGGESFSPFLTRTLRVQLHVWGRTYDETEQLVEDVLAALYMTISRGSLRFGGEQWVSQETHERRNRGDVAVITIEIDTPAIPTTLGRKQSVELEATGGTIPGSYVDDV